MIRLSRLADYGVLLMSHIARKPERVCTAISLSENAHLPVPTVSKLLAKLARAGLLQSIRGRDGGYLLALEPKDITNNSLEKIKIKECIIVDHYEDNISENLLYSILNQAKQDGQYVLINSVNSVKKTTTKLKDLKSRLNSFITLGINLPTDNLLRVIITKSFSDKQIKVNVQILEYILKNIDRSYEKIFKFIKNVDKESLSSGKSININLIKKILKKNEHI